MKWEVGINQRTFLQFFIGSEDMASQGQAVMRDLVSHGREKRSWVMQVAWEAVNKRISLEVSGWVKNVECDENSGELLLPKVQTLLKRKVKVFISQSCLTSLWPHGLYPSSLLCSWDFPGRIMGVGSHSLLQGIFPNQESNPGLPHCGQSLYCLSHQGSPIKRHLTIVFLVALTERAVAVLALRQGGRVSPCRRVQRLAIILCGSMVVPLFWARTPRAFPSYSYTKRWDIQGQLGSSSSFSLLQRLCCLIISLMLSQSCCSLVEYTKEVWSQERNWKSNYGNKQLAQEILPVRDSFGVLGILEWPRSTFRFRCSSCSDPNFPSGSALKNLPAMQELQVQSLVREDTLEEGMATHSSTLARRIPWAEKPGRLQSMESQSQIRLKRLGTHAGMGISSI